MGPVFFRRRVLFCGFACRGRSLLLFVAGLLAVRAQEEDKKLMDILLNPEAPQFQKSWDSLYCNLGGVHALGALAPEVAAQLLQVAQLWSGENWTTSKASLLLYQTSGIPFVSSSWEEYKQLWLYTLALYYGVDVLQMNLAPEAAQAAFTLVERLASEKKEPPKSMEVDQDHRIFSCRKRPVLNTDVEEEDHFDWEEHLQPLPDPLGVLWRRYGVGGQKFDTRNLLEDTEKWQDLPLKPPENNALHKFDTGYLNKADRVLKTQQQTLLNIMRVQARLLLQEEKRDTTAAQEPPQEDEAQLQLQLWAYCASQYHKLLTERREQTLPGSSPEDQDVLFRQEEMKEVQQRKKVKDLRRGMFTDTNFWHQYRFRPSSPSGTQFRGKSFGKAYGKGFGKSTSFGFGKGKASSWGFRNNIWQGKGKGRGGRGIAPPTRTLCPTSSPSQVPTVNNQAKGTVNSGHCGTGMFHPKRTALCSSLLPQSESLSTHLAKTGFPSRSSKADQIGSPTRLATSTIKVSAAAAHSSGSVPSHGSDAGLPSSGGSKTNLFGKSKIFSSLVYHCQTGRKWRSKSETHSRLQRIESVPPHKKVQVRSHSADISCLKEKYVGHQNRLKACLLSSSPKFKNKPLCLHADRRKMLPISGSMFWPKYSSTGIYASHESPSQTLEKTRHANFHLPRRHSSHFQQQKFIAKTKRPSFGDFGKNRFNRKCKKEPTGTLPRNKTLRFHLGLQRRVIASPCSETQNRQKRIGKIGHLKRNLPKKDGSHFGHHKKFFSSPSLFKSLHKSNEGFCESSLFSRLGSKAPHSRKFTTRSKGSQRHHFRLGRKTISAQSCHKKTSCRLIHHGMGRTRFNNRQQNSRILEGQTRPPHKYQRVVSCNRHSPQSCKEKRMCSSSRRQFSGIQLPKETGRKKNPPKQNFKTLFRMVSSKQSCTKGKLSKFRRNASRCPQQITKGHRRLHFGQKYFSANTRLFSSIYKSRHRHVCKPRQLSVDKICQQVASLASSCLQFPRNGPHSSQRNLCQSPLENHPTLAHKIKRKPTPKMSHGHTLLGWKCMVAPTNKTALEGYTSPNSETKVGTFSRLPGPKDASYQMAPPLPDIIRQSMERKQVSSENIRIHLTRIKSLQRYDQAFRKLWAFMVENGTSPLNCPMEEVAIFITRMASLSLHEARNAYSACIFIPELDSLRFSKTLQPIKRLWNFSPPKYQDFWDGKDVLQKLATTPINWSSIVQVRDRLIITMRLLHLTRSIDLQRTYRTLSFYDEKLWILIQRKGAHRPSWEEMMSLPEPLISPKDLLLHYVTLTCSCAPGTALLRHLRHPFAPLRANTIGSITKTMLQKFGIPNIFGPHSTRGAAVKMYKTLGSSSEHVCALGKWKDSNAFNKHYLRLNTVDLATELIQKIVHKVPPGESAEVDWSQTPGSPGDLGGSDLETEAQAHGGPALPTPLITGKGKKRTRESRGESPPKKAPPLTFTFAKPRHQREPPTAVSKQ